MATVFAWLLTLLGPVWGAVRPWLPAAGALRSIGIGVGIAALLAGGALLVWWLRDASESDAVAARAQAIVERANLTAENKALKAAARQADATLRHREAAIEASAATIAELEAKLKEKRDASPNPDVLVVPPGDPWLGRPAAGGLRKHP
jgi:hypothetical protein